MFNRLRIWLSLRKLSRVKVFYPSRDVLFAFMFFGQDPKLIITEWVRNHIKSIQDTEEDWQMMVDTLKRGMGDCEDKAILLANLLLMSGIPYQHVMLNAGMTSAGSHVWVTLWDGRKWQILDPSLDNADYGELWFSWNAKQAYASKENIGKWKK